jgi:endo-1,3-1,4-beta-glycanase ExoK
MDRSVASVLTLGLLFGVGCGSPASGTPAATGATTGQATSGVVGAGTGATSGGAGAGATGSIGVPSGVSVTGASAGTASSGNVGSGSSTGAIGSTGIASAGVPTTGASGAAAGARAGASAGASTGMSAGMSTGSAGSSAGASGSCNATAIAGVIGHPDPCINYPTRPGYDLYLAEEFEQPIDLDNDPNWTWSDGAIDQGQVRFIESQITFAGGNMLTTTEKTAQPTSMSYAENTTIGPKPLSSGEFRTKYNNYRYGWYEARYKPPTDTTGNFISTLFAFRTPKTIAWREIDNELTANGLDILGTNVYWQNNAGNYVCNYADQLDVTLGIANVQSDFHVYAMEWAPTYIKWYVDDMTHPVRTKTPTEVVTNCPGSTFTVAIPELSAKIMMNLWIFASANGYGGNDPTKNAYPMTSMYDYFRFYKAATGESTYPCSPTPGCIAHSDIIMSKNNPNDGVPYNAN